MSKENYINKIKDLPESLRQFIGLIFITLIVIVSFSILNGIFGQGDDLVKRMKLEEERIAEEKKLSDLISKLPSGILVSFDGTDHYKLTDEVYEQVCKATKLIPQRAIMGANFLNFRAHMSFIQLMEIKLMRLLSNGMKKKANVLRVLQLVEIM